ncbi:Cell cycle control protein 50C [Fukomys damarensis]|uniref:Cell cycle control protein n=1 Tax=Fukomys damarensis TaxID=885580 RepID=A0A091D6H4_FUKDA|nr:Cell cycle control protein 50C [Fukomys damarensis]
MKGIPEHHLSRMPDNTAMKQQNLPAYQLRFSATVVLSIFFGTGVFCLCMGVILILSVKSTKKIEINYTKICSNCAQLRENAFNFDKECICSIPFYLPEKMEGNVYMYYKLSGFYQNLYRYIQSRSNNQLVGEALRDVEDCAPFKVSHHGTPIVPCGAIANSMFNGSTKPPYWPKPIYDLDRNNVENNGFLNDDFIVWMRTAAFPTFKKLYRRLYRIHYFTEGLPADFPVTRFHGEKSVVLSTLTWCGGGGFFLGVAYTVTGALTWLASFALMAVHLMWKKKKIAYQKKSYALRRKTENRNGQ